MKKAKRKLPIRTIKPSPAVANHYIVRTNAAYLKIEEIMQKAVHKIQRILLTEVRKATRSALKKG